MLLFFVSYLIIPFGTYVILSICPCIRDLLIAIFPISYFSSLKSIMVEQLLTKSSTCNGPNIFQSFNWILFGLTCGSEFNSIYNLVLRSKLIFSSTDCSEFLYFLSSSEIIYPIFSSLDIDAISSCFYIWFYNISIRFSSTSIFYKTSTYISCESSNFENNLRETEVWSVFKSSNGF
jgi:hypothetical protein